MKTFSSKWTEFRGRLHFQMRSPWILRMMINLMMMNFSSCISSEEWRVQRVELSPELQDWWESPRPAEPLRWDIRVLDLILTLLWSDEWWPLLPLEEISFFFWASHTQASTRAQRHSDAHTRLHTLSVSVTHFSSQASRFFFPHVSI